MKTDLRVVVPNRHGAALALFDAIAAAGVNVDGMCGDLRRGERWGYIHVLTDDGPGARAAVEAAGFEVAAQQQVDVIEVEDRPGTIADVLRPFHDAGRNISVLYIATGTRVVIGTEDMLEQRPGVKISDAERSALVHLPISTVAFERPCIPARGVTRLRRGRNWDSICRSRTLRVRSAPRAWRTGAQLHSRCAPYFRCGALSSPGGVEPGLRPPLRPC